MPRRLPWNSSSGGGNRTQTTRPPLKTRQTPDDIDDDFLDVRSVAESSRKSKSKAQATTDSVDSLPSGASTPRNKKAKTTDSRERLPSSSPPPLADYALSQSYPLRRGVSKFDLRDDEWMMVEDEFLETAKLFTRHLHIAEYDRLKETIEAKKHEAETARPVVEGAKRSAEGGTRERVRSQESKQKRAIRDVFAALGDESEEGISLHRPGMGNPTVKPQAAFNETEETDSDDLDVRHTPTLHPKPAAAAFTQAPKPDSALSPASAASFARPALPATTKPALPAPAKPPKPRSRPPRITPFDMLDSYTAPPLKDTKPQHTASRSQSTSSTHSSPQTTHGSIPSTKETRSRSLDTTDDWGSPHNDSSMSKEAADRIAKRRAGRARESKGKADTRLEDIPTFLF